MKTDRVKEPKRKDEGRTVSHRHSRKVDVTPCECKVALKKPGSVEVLRSTGNGQISITCKPDYTTPPTCIGDRCSEPKVTYTWTIEKIEGNPVILGPTDEEEVLVSADPDSEFKLGVTVKVRCERRIPGLPHVRVISNCEDSGSSTFSLI